MNYLNIGSSMIWPCFIDEFLEITIILSILINTGVVRELPLQGIV